MRAVSTVLRVCVKKERKKKKKKSREPLIDFNLLMLRF